MTQEKKQGYFVEFGACDGRLLSNSLLLERQYDWAGLLAEPNPVWHHDLEKNRTCAIDKRCVYTNTGETVAFTSTPKAPELSRISNIVPDDVHERNGNRDNKETIDVETVSLLDLLTEHKAPAFIDYLSIDTEGSEYEILKAFDFNAYTFGLITVEHAGENSKREHLQSLLTERGYQRWRPVLSRWDDWYVHKEATNFWPSSQ